MDGLDFGKVDLNSIEGEMIEVNVEDSDGKIENPTIIEEVKKIAKEAADEPSPDEGKVENKEELIEIEEAETLPQGYESNKHSGRELSPSDSNIIAFAKALSEQGVLSDLPEDFDGTTEGLIKLVQDSVNSGVEAYKNDLPPVIKDLVNNYEDNVPLKDLINTKSREIQYSTITEEAIDDNVDLQKALIAEDLKNRGYTEEKISKRLDLFESNDVLVNEAKDAQKALVNVEKYHQEQLKKQTEQDKELAAKKNEENLSNIKKNIGELKEIIPGINLNDNSRENIYKSMTSVVETDTNGRPMNAVMKTRTEDPLKFETTLHYLHSLGVFDGDWSKIRNVSKSNAMKELTDKLNNNTSTMTPGKGVRQSQLSESIMSGLKVFNRD
tara:strand:- start:638 stop:1786 length:1149 start_codon:yes stop_codon:yes gene_type:complete